MQKRNTNVQIDPSLHCLHTAERLFSRHTIYVRMQVSNSYHLMDIILGPSKESSDNEIVQYISQWAYNAKMTFYWTYCIGVNMMSSRHLHLYDVILSHMPAYVILTTTLVLTTTNIFMY